MTNTSPLIDKTPATPRSPLSANPHAAPSRDPEWPRLTRREMRQIVLDILG